MQDPPVCHGEARQDGRKKVGDAVWSQHLIHSLYDIQEYAAHRGAVPHIRSPSTCPFGATVAEWNASTLHSPLRTTQRCMVLLSGAPPAVGGFMIPMLGTHLGDARVTQGAAVSGAAQGCVVCGEMRDAAQSTEMRRGAECRGRAYAEL